MAIKIKFDLAGNPEPPTIVLANRNGNKLGQLYVDAESINLKDKLNDASEFSFTLNKYIDGKLNHLWDKVVDFKLVYCKEWDMWFEITVELDEATETVKTVLCTQLGQAELSQLMLYNIEINTENDIARDDYKITILWDADDPEASLLHRLLKDKAPHYSVIHVDSTIARIQRTFDFDNTSIYDAFQEIGEEIGCLFDFPSNSDGDGNIQRTIAVYDLQQNCLNNDCRHRGDFTDVCPECGSTNIRYGYGKDTLIFVTSDELASDGIELSTDTDSVKNCFKLEAGDDLMTATIRNCNPNGTDYIWRFSDSMKEDMSDELVEKIESYDARYKEYQKDKIIELDNSLLAEYNVLVDKYSVYDKELQKIVSPIKGYSSLMNAYYNTIDLELYLKSSLMPSVEISGTDAEEQASLLTSNALSPVAVSNIDYVSLATANSTVLAMAKIIVKPTYKVQINESELSEGTKVWKGNFVITNYSDEEDTAISNTVSVQLSGDVETFVEQKLEKLLNKENTEDFSISGLFKKEHNSFCDELKKYALNPLLSFLNACQACIDILIEQDIGSDTSSDLYKNLYKPYYDKMVAIESEIAIREKEINIISGVYDTDGNLITYGLQNNIEDCRNEIHDFLNFEGYLGNELWLEFCSYRREDKYSNDNYISDGLNNAEIFERALEFYEVAENEIYKASELQHSISTTLNNLLAIPKFKFLVESFEVGNWIRIYVDNNIYKLRLLEYEIDYGDFNNIPVEFSDVTKVKNGTTDVQDILSQASSMATSYDSIQRQASKGNDAKSTINQWIEEGLNTANVRIQSNDDEDIQITKNGLLCRTFDDVTGTYSPEQLKLTHNIMAYTDDNWQTVRQAIGKHDYKYYNKTEKKFVNETGYGVTATFLSAGYISGSQIIGGEVYSENYSRDNGTGSYINLLDGTFNFGGGKITFNGTELIVNPDNGLGVSEERVTEIAGGLISTAEIRADQITSGKINADQIDAESIKVGDLTNDIGYLTESGVTTIVNGVVTTDYVNALGVTAGKISADNIVGGTISADRVIIDGYDISNFTNDMGYQTSSGVSRIITNTVDADYINAFSIEADTLKGGTVYIKNSSGTTTAYLYPGATTASGLDITSRGTLYLKSSGSYITMQSNVTLNCDNFIIDNCNCVRPNKIAANLGHATAGAWEDVYLYGNVNDLSDKNYKNSIEDLSDKYLTLFDLITPKRYKFNNGTSNRFHTGFIAQNIEKNIYDSGLDTNQFAGFVKAVDEETGKETCYLRYDEFVALAFAKIKQLEKRVIQLEK